jgi:hypothetical protein
MADEGNIFDEINFYAHTVFKKSFCDVKAPFSIIILVQPYPVLDVLES